MAKVSAPREFCSVPVIQSWLGLVSVFTGTAASPLRPHPGNKSPVDKPPRPGYLFLKASNFHCLPLIECLRPSIRNEKETRV